MPQTVDVPDVGLVEFPDDASQREIYDYLNKQYPQEKPKTSAVEAAALGAAGSIAPSAAFAATAPFGAKAGAGLTALIPGVGETGIAELIGGGIGALAVGGTAAALTSMGQEKLLKAVLPESVYNKLQAERKAAQEEHEVASVAGEVAGGIPSFKLATAPGDWALKKLVGRAALGAGVGAVQPLITDQRLPTGRDIATGAAFTAAFAEPRFRLPGAAITKGVPDATQEGQQQESRQPERPGTTPLGLPTEASGGNRPQPTAGLEKEAQIPLEPRTKIEPELDRDGRKTGLYTVTFGMEKQTGIGSLASAKAIAANMRASYTPPPTAAEKPAEPMAEEMSAEEAKRLAEREAVVKKSAEDLAVERQEREGMAIEEAKKQGLELSPIEPGVDQPFTGGGFLKALGGNRVAMDPEMFHRWAEEHVKGDLGEAIRSVINEERVHNDVINTIGNKGAESYWNDLTGFEKAVTAKTYGGSWKPTESPTNMGHEAIRYRLQKAMGMTPSEYAQLAGVEKWGIKSINALAEMVRATREALGTKASQRQLDLLNKIGENLAAAAQVAAGGPGSRIRKFTKQGFSQRTEGESKYQPGLGLGIAGSEKEQRVAATEAGATAPTSLKSEAQMRVAVTDTPNFDAFNEWAKRNVSGQGFSARLQAWKDALTSHLADASGERLAELVEGLGLAKEVGSAPLAQPSTGLSAKKGSLVQTGLFPGLGDEPSAPSTYRVGVTPEGKPTKGRIAGEKTAQERRALAITEIYRELTRKAQPEPLLDRKEIGLGDIDFANARAKHGSFRPISDEESTDPGLLFTLLSDHSRPSKDTPLSHTQRLVALKDRNGESVRLVSVYPERGQLTVVDPAKAGTTERPGVPMDDKFLARFQPIASVLLPSPVKNFHQRFESLADWNAKIGKDAARIAGVGDAEALMAAKRDWREAWDEAHPDEPGALTAPEDAPVGLRPEDIVEERQQAATQVTKGEGGGLTGEFTEEGRALMGIGKGELYSREPLSANEALAVRDLATDPTRLEVTSKDQMFEMVGRALDRIERVSKTKMGSFGVREPKPENLRAADFKAVLAIYKASRHLLEQMPKALTEEVAQDQANHAYSRAVEEFYEIIKASKDEADFVGKAVSRFSRPVAERPATPAQIRARPIPSESTGVERELTMPEKGKLPPAMVREPADVTAYGTEGPPETSPVYLEPEAEAGVRAVAEKQFPYDPQKAGPEPGAFEYPVGKEGEVARYNAPKQGRYFLSRAEPGKPGLVKRYLREAGGARVVEGAPEPFKLEGPASKIRKRGEEAIDSTRSFLGAWGSRREVKSETIHTGRDIAEHGAVTLGAAAYREVHNKSLAEIELDARKNPKGFWANFKTRLAQAKEATKVRSAAKAVIATGEIQAVEKQVQWVPSKVLDWKAKAQEGIDRRVEWYRKRHKKADVITITREEEAKWQRIAKEYGQPRPVTQTRKFWVPNKAKLDELEAQAGRGLANAQEMQKGGNPWNRKIGKMWEKEAQRRLDEVRYARDHWNDTVMRETVATIRKTLRNQWQWEHDHGLDVSQFMNYVPDRYEGELWNDNSILFSKWEVLGRNFRKARRFDNAYQAIEHGPYILKTGDAADLVGHRVRQGANAVNKGIWYQKMTETQDPVSKEPVAYWTKQVGAGDPKIILKDGSTADKPLEYETMSFDGDRTHLAVRKGFVNAVKAAAGESAVRNTPVIRDALRFGQFLKHNGILIYDSFHFGRLAQYGMSLTGWPTWQKGWSVLEFSKDALSGKFPGDAPEVLRKGILSPKVVQWATEPVEVNLGGGKKLATTRWDIAQQAVKQSGINIGRLQDTLYNQTSHLLPGLRTMNRFVFDKMTRGLMMQAFVKNFEKFNAKYPEIPFQTLMRDVAKDVNFRFGAIGRQGLIKQPWVRDMTQLFFLAPQWVEGLAQSEARSLGRFTGISQITGRKGLPPLGTLGTSMAKGLGAYFAFTQVLNLITEWGRTGTPKFTWQNEDKDHLLDARVHLPWTDESADFYISPASVFAELSHDIIRYFETKPKLWDAMDQVGRNKLGPWGRMGMVLARQKNERGEQITSTAGIAKEAASQLAPYPITFQRPGQLLLSKVGLAAPPQPGVTARQLLASGAGIKSQAVDSASRQVSRMADHFLTANNLKAEPVELTPTDQASYGKLSSALRAGDNRGAKRVMDELLRTKTIDQVFHGMKVSSQRPFTGSHAHEQLFLGQLSNQELDLYTKAQQERIEGFNRFITWITSR